MFQKKLLLFLISLLASISYTEIIDFETGFNDCDPVTDVMLSDGNMVTFGVGLSPLDQTCAYIGKAGSPVTAYSPDDRIPDGLDGQYFLADEDNGPSIKLNYYIKFKDRIHDFALDLYDYRNDGGPNIGDSVTVSIYSDDFTTKIADKKFMVVGGSADPNVFHFNLTGFGMVKSAGVVFQTYDVGTAIDNLSYNNYANDTIIPKIDYSFIYDNNGDGIADSLVITFKDTLSSTVGLTKMTEVTLEWPKNSTVTTLSLSSFIYDAPFNLIFIDIGQTEIKTDGVGNVDVTFDSLGNDIKRSADVQDGIGPLLVPPAFLKERFTSGNDTFFVEFTEKVNVDDIKDKSFYLIKNGTSTKIELTLLDPAEDIGNQKSIQFAINDLGTTAPVEGDSLQIIPDGPVSDEAYDNTAHKDNTPVPIMLKLLSISSIDNAIIHDNDGNGKGDSLVVRFKKDIDIDKIAEGVFEWPAGGAAKNISLPGITSLSATTIYYSDFEMSDVLTHGVGDLEITFDSIGVEIKKESDIEDGIGPILEEAFVVKRYVPVDDTFRVRLTEAVKVSEITGLSFVLIKGDNGDAIDIEPVDGDVTDLSGELFIEFLVEDLGDDAPQEGDSLKILHSGPVADKKDNSAHKDNPPVPIRFLDGLIPPKKAGYYDLDGNGYIDNVRVEFADVLKNLDSLYFEIEWIDTNETVAVKNSAFESGSKSVVLLSLKEEIKDKTDGDMELTVKNNPSNSGQKLTVNDKAAPVIVQATYYPSGFVFDPQSGTDSLIVEFSESVNDVSSDRPFSLETLADKGYYFTLDQKERTDETVRFDVLSIEIVSMPVEGDSIWIDADEGVDDIPGNPQTVDDNKKVKLLIEWPTLTFIPQVIGPMEPDEKEIPDILQISDEIMEGTIIALVPSVFIPHEILKDINCRMKIFDAVGNEVASCDGRNDKNGILEMDLPAQPTGPDNMIVILWSEKNKNGRIAEGGTYLGWFEIIYVDGESEFKKVTIPVKR